jgi:hypothetical protein
MKLSIITVMLCACGAPFSTKTACLSGEFTFNFESETACERASFAVDLATKIMSRYGLKVPPGPHTIWVWQVDSIDGEYGRYWQMSGDIEIGYDLSALVHEIEHALASYRGLKDDDHEAWKDCSTGFSEADRIYSCQMSTDGCSWSGDCQ